MPTLRPKIAVNIAKLLLGVPKVARAACMRHACGMHHEALAPRCPASARSSWRLLDGPTPATTPADVSPAALQNPVAPCGPDTRRGVYRALPSVVPLVPMLL